MPEGRIVYIVGFPIERPTGRAKATRAKADALRSLAGKERFLFYHPRPAGSLLGMARALLIFDRHLRRTARTFDTADIIVMRQCFLPLTIAFLRRRGIAIVFEIHADALQEIPLLLQKGTLARFFTQAVAQFEARQLPHARGFIFNNPLLADNFLARYPRPSITIYNGADPAFFAPGDRNAARRKLGLDLKAPHALFLGAVARWHGVEKLIDTFRQPLLNEHQLLIVGLRDNALARALRDQAQGAANIRFYPFVPPVEAQTFIQAADIGLLPVDTDMRISPGSPLKLYDYIACGKPVVAQCDTPGYADEVMHHQLGITVDFNQPLAAATAISAFIRTLDAARYREHNRVISETALSWAARMKEWMRFFGTLK